MLLKVMLCLLIFSLVVEALKEVDGSRKCFRLVGGVLVERTVNEVLPALTSNYEQVGVNHTPLIDFHDLKFCLSSQLKGASCARCSSEMPPSKQVVGISELHLAQDAAY